MSATRTRTDLAPPPHEAADSIVHLVPCAPDGSWVSNRAVCGAVGRAITPPRERRGHVDCVVCLELARAAGWDGHLVDC